MTNNKAVQTQRSNPTTELRNELLKLEPQFKMALPDNVTPEKFVRVVLNTVMSNTKFLSCDRTSLYAAAMKCAADGLLPDGREAAMIPYGNTVQYQPMVYGIHKKVRNSGEIAILCAELVYPSDFFEYGTSSEKGRFLDHKPKLGEQNQKMTDVIAVFALSKTKDGDVDFEVMTRTDIEFVRSKSKSPNSPAWAEWWGEMAKKTVIKRLSKRLPMSADVQKIIEHDNEEYDVATTVARAKAEELSHKLENEFASANEDDSPFAITVIDSDKDDQKNIVN